MIALADAATEHLARQRSFQLAADQALEFTRTELGFVAFFREMVDQRLIESERHALAGGAARHAIELQADDVADLLLTQRMEDDDLVDAVEELGPEVAAQHVHDLGLGLFVLLVGRPTRLQPSLDDVRTQVGRGDDDGVGEIHHPALAVGEATVVEHLQQDVVDVRVCLLDLVEQQHAVGLAPHLLGELTAFVVTDIARRRAHQPRHGMAFAIFRHVDAQQGVLIAVDRFGQCLGELGLAHPGRAQKQEGSHRFAAFAQAGAGQPHGIGHGTDRLVLSHQALVQPLFQVQQLFALFHRQLVDRDAGQARDDLRHVFRLDLCTAGGPLPLPVLDELLELGLLGFDALAELGGLVVLLARGHVILFTPQLVQFGLQLLHGHRPGRGRQLHARGRLVEQVDRLVRQEARRDVAVGQLGRRDDRVLGDADLVVRLEGVAQAAQNHDGLGHRRLGHRHRLEAPLQCGILLDVFLVLVQRRGADQVEFTARHHRFEYVGHVQPAFATALAGTDDGVHLVDEQNQLALVLGHLLQHLLHALLELAAIFGAGHHGVDVEFHQALVAQGLGHFTRHHALRQPFDDGGLAHTRLADQHRVVLLAPGQHLDGGFDLLRAADHRVELAVARHLGQVARVLVEFWRVGRRLSASILGALADHLADLLAQRLRRQAVAAQQVGGQPFAFLGQTNQEMLWTDIRMTEFIGGHEGAAERILHARRHADLALEGLVPALGLRLDLPLEVIDLDLELTQDGLDHVAVGQRQQQMFGIHLGAAKFGSVFGGLLQQGFRLFADAAGQPTAATARRTRTCGGGLAKRGIDHVIGIGGNWRRVVADAEEVTAEEVLEQAAARTEQGFQRRNGALLLAH